MYSKKFFNGLIIRIVLIFLVCMAIAITVTIREKWFSIVGLLVVLTLQIIELFRFIIRIGNSISDFIVSLIHNDNSLPISQNRISLINHKFIDNMKELQKSVSYVKSEQITQALFIENLLEHIDIGIIAILPNGKLKFRNNAVLGLLNIKSFKSLESIKDSHVEFYSYLIASRPGEDRLLSLYSENEVKKISLKTTQFISKDENIKLVFFQDIKNEIDESLLQSWQNLIRILTHEINNTVSPIASLADSLSVYLSRNGNKSEPINSDEIDQRSIDVSLEGVSIIKERSNGLIDFVSKYKSLLPKKSLTITNIHADQLFYRLKILFSEKLENSNISIVSFINPEDIIIKADQHYLEQVLINLISNSIDAYIDFEPTSKSLIELKSFQGDKGETIIQVIDNGKGISPENLDKVFIPFYSTKEKGTGIGLSLSIQIIRLHGGSMSVSSRVGEKTIFTIKI